MAVRAEEHGGTHTEEAQKTGTHVRREPAWQGDEEAHGRGSQPTEHERGEEGGGKGEARHRGESRIRDATERGQPVPLGRGVVDESLLVIAHLLNLEEHLVELGDVDLASDVRDARREVVDRVCREVFGADPESTQLKRSWCAVKHALLASYHSLEVSLATRSPFFADCYSTFMSLARSIMEKSLSEKLAGDTSEKTI